MATVTSYDAKSYTVAIDGIHITGLGEDMVSFEKEEAYFEPVVGAQGDIVVSEVNNDIHTITLTIQPTSPMKPFLLRKLTSRELFSIWVTSKAMGERFGGSKARIQEMPEIARGAEAEDIEITICVFDGVVEAI